MDPTQIPLRDVHLPDAIGIWPLAPGWWLVFGVVLGLSVVALRRALINYRAGAARRLALRQLKQIRNEYARHGKPVRFAADVSELLRRSMLAYSPRQDVAGLTGQAWLDWLDHDLALPQFKGDTGRALLELPYRNPDDDVADIDAGRLFDAAKMRLTTPVGDAR